LVVGCIELSDPINGVINCSLGDDGVTSFEDTCTYKCNSGYEVKGSGMRRCKSDGIWSGNSTSCQIGNE